ncbi:MAG: VCBS repeat-containing protein [Calditrichaeota bacterium]|nr:VCBS repeat-containing protein [Calditrichota bacterium]
MYRKGKQWGITLVVLGALLIVSCRGWNSSKTTNRICDTPEVKKLPYNHPGLLVDLDVGFKSVPMPMDFDGDGDTDLLVSESSSYVEAGVFYFENLSGNVEMPVFNAGIRISSPRFRLGYDGSCFETSRVNGRVDVLTPDACNTKLVMYRDVPQNVFWDRVETPLAARGYIPNTKYNRWKRLDFDGDSVADLLCALLSKTEGHRLLFFKNRGTNDVPDYQPPIVVRTANGKILGKNVYISTAIADFDRDGDLDVVAVGPYADFIYFENKGTPRRYRFAAGRQLKFKGAVIHMESRFGGAIKPTAFDWNRDGFPDIIAGDEDGKVSLLKNTGRIVDGLPVFLPPRFFQQKARYVDFGALTTPRIFDWDGDGLDDIVSGDGAGYIGFIKNLGGGGCPKWAKPELLKADGKIIRILPKGVHWGYTTIDVGDWNMDGLPDILVNHHNGNVLWFENIGSRRRPKLAAAKPVLVQWNGSPQRPPWVPGKAGKNELLAPWRTSPLIMDFNHDGLNDLVMLDYEGYLAVYLRSRDKNGKLVLGPAERRFVDPSGNPILLNQRTGSSSGRLKITFTDWDGDGLKDLIFSSKPAVDWMKNRGMKDGKMVLQYMGRVVSRTLMGHTDGPVTPDWNRDGVPDLLVGTETGVFYYWVRPSFQVTTTMTTTGPQKPAAYRYFKR